MRSREVHLVRRPTGGAPSPDDVAIVTVEVEASAGQVLVRNTVMSVEPYMRGRMSEGTTYVEPYALGVAMDGHATGVVEWSDIPEVPVGSVVVHQFGWREYVALDPSGIQVVDVEGLEPTDHLGALGQTGMTAWVGMNVVARVQPGDTVFVSSAAGGVGAIAGQLAKVKGCKVIGSCGSPEKVASVVNDFGFDVAFDYHDGRVRDLLRTAVDKVGKPGLDVYFDNVGSEHLEAAIREMNERGRIAMCGAIAVYNATEPVPGPRNLLLMIWNRLRMEGFLVGDHEDVRSEFLAEMTDLVRRGEVTSPETYVGHGIEEAFSGFLTLLEGRAVIGKALVSLGS
ncbi:NADP-dependent oxidoreductase [Rhodococcus sp. (in: high G+C Gram-positive bacteria)]|uniref:NADP-dependent oxidoreductase n=1 Tax=Rhodococcus sp. TaxID=1831 RepID=UPI00257E8E2A|nr:NADP-dependent oxidoreductase [Rhodococcus sp. (in: high G+C Gram-positive bacteria)]